MIEEIRKRPGGITGVPSGFTDLDEYTRGFQPGTLIVLGARPGLGKSSIATNIAQHAAAKGHHVGIFTLEMPNEELFIRQMASASRIDSHRIQSGYLSEHEWAAVSEAYGRIAESTVYLDQTPAISLLALRSRARRLLLQRGLQLLIVDYLQLMDTSASHETRALAIGVLTGALKALAKELHIPVLVLSQLNRESSKGDRPRRPQLSDLRDSGSIEQDADIVLFLHRGEDDPDDVTDLLIAKHRNGPIGTIKLRWHERFTTFEDYRETPRTDDRALPVGSR